MTRRTRTLVSETYHVPTNDWRYTPSLPKSNTHRPPASLFPEVFLFVSADDERTDHDALTPAPSPPVSAAPDGGLVAWSQVLAGHLVAFNSWGYVNSFGLFQAYYTTTLNQPPSKISWIGSIQIFLTLFIGTFAGRAMDAGFYRHVAFAGLALQVLGVFMTSLVTEYWQLLLAQGICQGLGNGLVFTPTVALVSTYFVKNRAVAISGMTSGTATGGIVFPVIARQLLAKVGFSWTIKTMGFVMLANAAIVVALARPRPSLCKTGPLIELAAFTDIWYSLFGLGLLLALLGLYFGYYYVSHPNHLVTFGFFLTNTVDHSLCSRYCPCFTFNVPRFTAGDQCNGHTRSSYARLGCGSLPRASQYPHHHCGILWNSHLYLG